MRPPRRGVALMLSLWLIVVLGAVAMQVAATAREESALVGNVKARTAARYAAESGIVAARERIELLLDSAVAPPERVRRLSHLDTALAPLRNVDIGAARFTVAAADLNARIDLNRADDSTLFAFFRQFAREREARSIVDALADYKDADDLVRAYGAETEEYERARSPWLPRNARLQRIEELRRVHGVTDMLARAVAPYVAVGGNGRVNINTAPESVLAALSGLGPSGARTIVSRRRTGELFTSPKSVMQVLGSPASARTSGEPFTGGASSTSSVSVWRLATEPSHILLLSRGWLRGHPLTHEIEAVFAVSGRRLTLYSWRERDL